MVSSPSARLDATPIGERHRRVGRRRRVLMRIEAAPAEGVDGAAQRHLHRRRLAGRDVGAPLLERVLRPARHHHAVRAGRQRHLAVAARADDEVVALGGERRPEVRIARRRDAEDAQSSRQRRAVLAHVVGERAALGHEHVVRGAGAFADGDLELRRPAAADALGAHAIVARRHQQRVPLRRRARHRHRPLAIVEVDVRARERLAGRLLEDAPRQPPPARLAQRRQRLVQRRVGRRADDEPAHDLDARARRQVDDTGVEVAPLPVVARVEWPFGERVGVGRVVAEAAT